MRRELEKRIKKQRAELESIEIQISELNDKKKIALALINEYESLIKTLPKEDGEPVQEKRLRHGTDVYQAREILRIWRQPLYIDKIITYMNEEPTADRRRSLSSQISAYVREGQIFTRPGPNIFGLKEFENQSSEQIAKTETEADIDFSHVDQVAEGLSEKKGGAIQGEMPDFPF